MPNKILLRGCAPEPLIHYLKALGIMRLVAEQLDKNVRGAWTADGFLLETSKTEDELIEFFLNKYEPTPIVTPWNKDGVFLNAKLGKSISDEGDKGKKRKPINFGEGQSKGREFSFQSIKNSENSRLSLYRETISSIEKFIEESISINTAKNPVEAKRALVPFCRNKLSNEVVQWLDAVCLIDGEGKSKTPFLLGGGGNDARLDFAITFMGQISEVLPLKNELLPNRKDQLISSIFGETASKNSEFSSGHFNPIGIGGANATNGIRADNLSNPWNFILAIEGTLLFAGAATRRLSAGAKSDSSYPFWVHSVQLDDLVEVNEENNGELFLPIWEKSVSFSELSHLFNEGRLRFKKKLSTETIERDARDSIQAAQAIASLGIDRGILRFQRFVLLKRNGDAKFATSLGSFEVNRKRSPKILDLFEELEKWVSKFRELSRGKTAPKEMSFVRRNIDKAIFDYCSSGEIQFLEQLLLSLGNAEIFLNNRKNLQEKISPILLPNFGWLKLVENNKFTNQNLENELYREFNIAQALASIVDAKGQNSIRENIEPVEYKNGRFVWVAGSTRAVWGAGDLAENLSNILHRRSIDARSGGQPHPQLKSKSFASLDAIAAFLDFQTDDERLEDYLFALNLIDWHKPEKSEPMKKPNSSNLPRIYALLKLLFLPDGKLKRENTPEIEIKHEPSIVPLLRAGRISDALETAERRLKSSGVVPLTSDFYYPESEGARLAAALLIPIDQPAINELARLVLPEPQEI